MNLFGLSGVLIMFMYLVIIVLGVYLLLLLINLIKKGTKALEVYIDINERSYNQDIKK
jgi:amino acid transporter